jgi:hypothetical protein
MVATILLIKSHDHGDADQEAAQGTADIRKYHRRNGTAEVAIAAVTLIQDAALEATASKRARHRNGSESAARANLTTTLTKVRIVTQLATPHVL